MRTMTHLPLLALLAVAASGCEKEMLTAVGPSEALAQEAGAVERRRGPGMPGRGMNPLGRVLEQREALALSAEQVTRLESIAASLKTRNEALRAQIQTQMPERPAVSEEQREAMRERRRAGERPTLTAEQREAMRERRESLRPLLEQAAESQRTAMAQVREILTDEQEAKLRELRPERAGMRERRGGFPGGMRGPRGPAR